MIYVFAPLPKSTPPTADLLKSFNNFGTGPQVASKMQLINSLRDNFYQYVETIDKLAPNQFVGELNWMPMMEYLQNGPDLLELGVKAANFPFTFRYLSVLSPSKDIIINDGRF